jgi:ligand-binding sensor domain-containing protein
MLASLLVMLFAPVSAWAVFTNQDFMIDAWGTEEGLPQSSVLSIAQTPDGYLWLATFDGLARFDARTFHRVGYQQPARTAQQPPGSAVR